MALTGSFQPAKKIIIIVGPTAAGKTAVAIEVAKKLNTVILSADSRQCYKELSIGVARPSEAELAAVTHYFIASHSIHQKIDAAFYETYALELLHKLFIRYDTVIVTGGTGLYIKALTDGLDNIPEVPETIRHSIIRNYETGGMDWLQKQIQLKDPKFTAGGEMQNPQRMMRALEVLEATGQSILSFQKGSVAKRDFGIVQVGLEMPRDQLNERIHKRVDEMMANGLEKEVRQLMTYRQLNAMQTVGYKELFDYFDGNCTLVQATDLIKQNTRRYAKRQMTWFKKQKAINWFNLSQFNNIQTLVDTILDKGG